LAVLTTTPLAAFIWAAKIDVAKTTPLIYFVTEVNMRDIGLIFVKNNFVFTNTT